MSADGADGAAVEQRVVDNPQESRFEVWLGDEQAGVAEYERRDGAYVILHTVIDDRFEGRGLGSTLARGALDQIRAGGQVVLPYCPFIRRYIDRHREYLDLVPADQRQEFRLPA